MNTQKYYIRYYCPDCTGNDTMGCHDGEFWYESKRDDDDIQDAVLFSTEGDAVSVAEQSVKDSIYKFDILTKEI